MEDKPSKKYKGVYYRQLKDGDRSYYLILRVGGKQKRVKIGKKSEGITEAFCYQQKVKIINTEKFGEQQADILLKTTKADPTFIDLVSDYCKHSRSSDGTKHLMQSLARVVPFASSRRVTERDITEWLTDYSDEVKPGTVNSKIKLLRMLFQHSADMKIYRHANPMASIKTLRVENKRLRWLNRDEVKTLLEALMPRHDLYLFTKIALCTGARLGSIIGIHESHIKADQVRLYNIKAKRWYTGFVDKETRALLKQRSGYVLSNKNPDVPPKLTEYQHKMRRVLDGLFNQGVTDPLDRVVVHTLRHTTASLLVQNGTPLHVVQKVLDHQSINSTERYAKLHQDNIKNELGRLWN